MTQVTGYRVIGTYFLLRPQGHGNVMKMCTSPAAIVPEKSRICVGSNYAYEAQKIY